MVMVFLTADGRSALVTTPTSPSYVGDAVIATPVIGAAVTLSVSRRGLKINLVV